MDARRQLGRVLGASLRRRAMVIRFSQRGVSLPAVRQQGASWLHGALDEGHERLCRDIIDYSESYAAGSSTAQFDGAYNDGLVAVALATSALSLFNSADVRLVDLDDTRDTVSLGPHHGTSQFLKHDPRRLVAIQTKVSLKLER